MDPCDICGGQLTWVHDHRPDNTGIDDGPPFPVRKKPAPKPAADIRCILYFHSLTSNIPMVILLIAGLLVTPFHIIGS